MKNVALITGASSGIGAALAHEHASKGGDLILIARNGELLLKLKEELEEKYKVKCTFWALDLSDLKNISQIAQNIEELDLEIDILINNAGFGGYGKFHERAWQQDEQMIDLNVKALSALTHVVLQQMVRRKKGKILNVASSAGFMPGPLQATYFATKAYVQSYSQAIAEEVKNEGITCTVLCPGPVRTNFEKMADLEGTLLFKRSASPKKVARIAYKAMMKGKLVVFNEGILAFTINWIVPLLPRKWMLKIVRKMQEK